MVIRRNGRELEVALGEQRDRLTGARTTRLPKGKIDPGETPEEAALREVREETGLAARVVGSLGSVAYAYREGGEQIDKRVDFFLMELEVEAAGETDGELERIRWESLARARARLSFETEREVLRRAEARLAAGPGTGDA